MANIEIIICTEKGYLESLSKLLIKSLRNFGGRFREIPIYSYQPRKYFKISNGTKQFFEEHEVEYIDLPLNKNFTDYPLANKPLACSYHEYNSGAETLVFLDSDIFFLSEPKIFNLPKAYDASLRPLDLSTLSGASSFHEPNGSYWKALYNLLKIQSNRTVTSTVDDRKIFEYYNSGHVIIHKDLELFSQWNDNFHRVMKAGLELPNGHFYVEQSVLSATITQQNLKILPSPKMYNFPIHLMQQIENEEYVIHSASELISVHYHKLFQNNSGQNPIMDFLNQHPNGQWVNHQLTALEIVIQHSRPSQINQKLWNKLQQILSRIS